tara:strand:+ start:9187 stop:9765 length:579 start_codon:yes stop_codon:yes gene_type:complete
MTEYLKTATDTVTTVYNTAYKHVEEKLPEYFKNNFTRVKEFMTIMGQEVPTEPTEPKLNPAVTNLRVKLIEEELSELKEALKNDDFVEVIDALADILYVTYGAGVAWGVDLQGAFDAVHLSNMSKMCKTQNEAMDTVKWYKDNPDKGYPSPTWKKEGKYYVVNESTTGKVLKSINYKPVDLKPFIKKGNKND